MGQNRFGEVPYRVPAVCVNNAMNCLTNSFSPEETQWEGVGGKKQAPELHCAPQQFGKHDLVSFPTKGAQCTNTIKRIAHQKKT